MAALRQNGEVFGDLHRQAPGTIRRANPLLLRSALVLGAALTALAAAVALLGDDPGATNRALRFVDLVGPTAGRRRSAEPSRRHSPTMRSPPCA